MSNMILVRMRCLHNWAIVLLAVVMHNSLWTAESFQLPRRRTGFLRHDYSSVLILSSSNNNDEQEQQFTLQPTTASSSSSSSSSPFQAPALAPEDALDLIRFQRRQQQLQDDKSKTLPPHPLLEPQQVVTAVLEELRATPYYDLDPTKPRPHPGVTRLWQASTVEWQQTMAAMVGVAVPAVVDRTNTTTTSTTTTKRSESYSEDTSTTTTTTTIEIDTAQIVSAVGRFLARPNQQFAILLGLDKDADYEIDFPTDVMEWSDDEAWLECRLRSSRSSNSELLVVLGWTLHRRQLLKLPSEDESSANNASCWYIHAFDWQDFRDDYRPGIGREEWERICG